MEGIWLLEQREDLTGKPGHSEPAVSSRLTARLGAVEGGEAEEGTSLYLTWSKDGLRVEVDAVLGSRAQGETAQLYTDLDRFGTANGVRAQVLGARNENEVRVALTASHGREVQLCSALGNLLEVLTQHHDPERMVVNRAA